MDDQSLKPGALRVIAGTVSGATTVDFAFNPTEYTIAKSATWTRAQMKGGKKTGKPEFNGANPQTLQLEIFLDASAGGAESVAAKIATLIGWVNPTEDSVKKKKPQPPILKFEWGENPVLTDFQAYLKTVTAKYVLFAPGGTPLRATANVTLEEVPPEAKKQNPTSGAIHGRRSHLLLEGESLAGLAWAEYEDAGLWRGLAAFNGIDDPLRVRPGRSLLLPTADEARRLS
jgi:Contractile injection system tube protein